MTLDVPVIALSLGNWDYLKVVTLNNSFLVPHGVPQVEDIGVTGGLHAGLPFP